MKKLFLLPILMMLFVLTTAESCDKPQKNNADKQMQKQTEQQMQEANRQIGMPAIKNFQERKLMKMILELRDDENLICYAYVKNDFTGKFRFIGKCLGYGLPYSVQYTNPEKVVVNSRSSAYGSIYGTLPQADPNGLFMPTGLSATWLMMLDKNGKPHPVYIESEIEVSPFELMYNVEK